MCIECPNHTRRLADFLVVPYQPAYHHQIQHHGGRCSGEIQFLVLLTHTHPQAYAAAVTEVCAGGTGHGINCDDAGIYGGGNNPRHTQGRGVLRAALRSVCCVVVIAHTTATWVTLLVAALGSKRQISSPVSAFRANNLLDWVQPYSMPLTCRGVTT